MWYLGRNAIYAALGEMGLAPGDPVIVPSYTNGVEVAALAARGLEIHQVQIGPDFSLDLDHLEQTLVRTRARLVLAIQYLGFASDLTEVAKLCKKHGAILFEDCALSFLAKHPDGTPVGTTGDVAIFSVYKTLPVADGAALVMNNLEITLPATPTEPDFASSASGLGRLLLAGARTGGGAAWLASAALNGARRAAALAFKGAGVERTAAGSMRFESKRLPWGASRFTRAILPRLDYAAIVEGRRRNFLELRKRLADVPTFNRSLPAGACPLFYPVIVPDKKRVIDVLGSRGIETVDFWSTWHPAAPPDGFPEITRLRGSVVELPCLQDLDEGDMEFIADAVIDALGASRSQVAVPALAT
jgi:dTDP-4-amino-4,6-dideoxygalactose transaminase